jgi:hypothetical protein
MIDLKLFDLSVEVLNFSLGILGLLIRTFGQTAYHHLGFVASLFAGYFVTGCFIAKHVNTHLSELNPFDYLRITEHYAGLRALRVGSVLPFKARIWLKERKF